MQYMWERYPHLAPNYTLENYFVKNFHPGVVSLFRDEIGMSEEQMAEEEKYWANYVEGHIPTAFPKIKEILDLENLEWNYTSLDKDLKLKEIEPLFVRMVL